MKKAIIIILSIVLVIGLGVLGWLGYQYWYQENHVFVGSDVYEKETQYLDFRGTAISVEYYEEVRQQLPNCEVRWDIPFQNGYIADDATEIAVTTLTEADIARLDYLSGLKTVDATGCQDYEMILALQAHRPDCQVIYQVNFNGEAYDPKTTALELTEFDPAELSAALVYLSEMQTIHITEPTVAAEELTALREQYPEIEITWEKTLFNVVYADDVTEFDFSGVTMNDALLDELAAAMPYFPDLEKVLMIDCGLENEQMAAFRDRVRPYGKVVWEVKVCGAMIRTDETYFMPVKYNIKVKDSLLGNLVYCEDMLCVDLGHKIVKDLSWLSGMPHLKYLIVAHNTLKDLTPIGQLKELIYLEVWDTWATDYTPLYGCTALEDLNVSRPELNVDLKQFGEMPWLKNLWLNQNSATNEERAYLAECLPNTNICYDGYSPTAGGWRELQNYYDMRDLLEMPYNPW